MGNWKEARGNQQELTGKCVKLVLSTKLKGNYFVIDSCEDSCAV